MVIVRVYTLQSQRHERKKQTRELLAYNSVFYSFEALCTAMEYSIWIMFKRFKSIDDFFFDLLTKQWNGMEFYETQYNSPVAKPTTQLFLE